MMTIIIILSVLLITAVYIVINQYYKITTYEEVVLSQSEEIALLEGQIEEVYISISEAYATIKTIDAKGSFEADDEVGFFFVLLKDLSQKLYSMFNTEETDIENE